MPNTPLPAALEKLCREYNTSSGDLNAELARFKVAMQELKVKFLPRLKQLAGVVARDEADLRVAIDAAPDAFKDPRTLVCHGTKVGFMKSEGTLETDDEKRSIALLHEKFPKKADADKYINTVEKLKKDAVKKLPISKRSSAASRAPATRL
jgi:hypothetical protein